MPKPRRYILKGRFMSTQRIAYIRQGQLRLVFRLLSYYFFDLKRKNEFFTHQVLRQALICTVLKGSLCLSHTAQVLFCGAAVNSHTTQ